MKNLLIACIVAALACAATSAQSRPAKTLKGTHDLPTSVSVNTPASVPAACNPCLWYSGDSDANNPLDNSTWNGYSPNYCEYDQIPCSGQVWVPFAPTSDGNLAHKHVSVTSVTFNETLDGSPSDLDGGTYQFNTFVSSGNAGNEFEKPTNCKSMTGTPTARSGEYAITCVLHKPIKLAVGVNYWVNILPTLNNAAVAYIDDVEDMPAPNQMGWGNIYFNSYASGQIYYPDWYLTEESCGFGCDAFSVAIAGTYVP
ncbi:MAG: hypothetical protein ACLPTZ_14425 [Beijerinckiaceae bacterium]|jgi:hypothetical protein